MGTDRRRDAATALTGATLLGAGGGLRHAGVTAAVRDRVGREPVSADYPKVHLNALKHTAKGRKLYLAGTAAGLVGTAGLGTGVLNLTRRRDVGKRHDRTPLWQEGVAGTADALRDRKASLQTKAPPRARGTQLAIAGGAGAGGSALARLAMRGASGKAKALVSPIAGALAATASVPASSRAVQHSTKGEYVVTPTGVRRAKDVIRKPSSKARQVSNRYGPMRHQVVPSSNVGKADSYRTQRAKLTALGSTPLVGPYAQAHQAAMYAPKGHKVEAGARQLAYGPVAGMAAGVGAAYGGAALARHVAPVGTKAEHVMQWRSDKINAVRGHVGLGPAKPAAEGSRRARIIGRAKANRLAKPLMHSRGTAAAATVGFLGARGLVGGTGTQLAISRNQRDQSRFGKLDTGGRGQSKREKHKLAESKRLNAALAVAGGSTSLTSLGLLATRHKAKAIPLSIVGSGIGGANALIGARVQRHEAKAIDPVRKARLSADYVIAKPTKRRLIETRKHPQRKMRDNGKQGERYYPEMLYGPAHLRRYNDPLHKSLGSLPWTGPMKAYHPKHGMMRVLEYHGEGRFTMLDKADAKRIVHRDQVSFRKSAGGEDNDLIRRYGDRGPLPKNIDRDERMRAYEARYHAHGGKKGEKWQRRANVSEGARNVALATGTAALAGLAHLKTKRGARLLAKRPHIQHRLDHLALASGAAGGAAELAGEYSRNRRASYASSPGGVAASALTRMRANTPGGTS